MAVDTKMTADFSTKPRTMELAKKVTALTGSLGPSRQETKAQVSFAGKRKFLWMWTYGHTADGTLYVTVCVDREIDDPNFHYTKQVSPNRWNHHVVVRSAEQIESTWFKTLVEAGYAFSNR